MEVLFSKIVEAVISYINQLDWSYIITLILISLPINKLLKDKKLEVNIWKWKLNLILKNRYRVPVVGLLLAVVFYYLDDRTSKADIKLLLQSMIAAMVIHLWFLEKIMQLLGDKASSMIKKRKQTEENEEN